MIDVSRPARRIRSFVRREGRLTGAQQRALDSLWPRYGVDYREQVLDLEALFGRHAPCTLEIGFGDGRALAAMAERHPEWNFLGIEVHRPGVGGLLLRIEELELANVRVICHDAVEVLAHDIPDAALDAVQVFFPDPWPKKRHHKRRLIQAEFVQLIRRKLRLGGRLHLATDWEHYAAHMMDVMSAAEGFRNAAGVGVYVARPENRPWGP